LGFNGSAYKYFLISWVKIFLKSFKIIWWLAGETTKISAEDIRE